MIKLTNSDQNSSTVKIYKKKESLNYIIMEL